MMAGRPWGRIIVGTRLEKQVSSRFFQEWTNLCTRGLSRGDGVLCVRGKPAHRAGNDIIRQFLERTEAESLLFLDSDAVDVPVDLLDQFRAYEDGWQYDMLQAFYCRRGWPPLPIWLEVNELGETVQMLITRENYHGPVSIAGTHCCLVRREVLWGVYERLGAAEGIPLENFDWFSYPRHREDSDEASLSWDAASCGFHVGATTAIRVGHLSEVATTWDTYMDWLRVTGRLLLLERYDRLARLVADFTGEALSLVLAKALNGSDLVREAWERAAPESAEEVRAFYGVLENGYVYDLVRWNCEPLYERIVAPLREVCESRALVIGPGLGTEVEILREGDNEVAVFEVPGVLRDFCERRFAGDDLVWFLERLPCYGPGSFGCVAVVDVLEHLHADDLDVALSAVWAQLVAGGLLVLHMGEPRVSQPQHFDNRERVQAWLGQHFSQEGEFAWRKN